MVLVLLAGALAVYRSPERDFWFHLGAGRWILGHGLPSSEPWCLSGAGQRPWLSEWLFHVALYVVRSWGGDSWIGVWRAWWAAATLVLSFRIARTVGAGPWTALLLTPLALAVTRERQTARPEQLTLAFVLLEVSCFEAARRAPRDRTLALLPLQVLWANLHPGWVLGPAIAWVYASAAWLEGRARGSDRGPRPAGAVADPATTGRSRAKSWALLGVALLAASGLTPRPLDTFTLWAVRDVQADPVRSVIGELRPWSWALDGAGAFTAFCLLVGLGIALGGVRAWKASPALAVLAAAAVALGLLVFRMRALAVMLALPVLALGLERNPPGRGLRLGRALAALAALIGAAWLFVERRQFEPGVAPYPLSVPVRAVEVADSLGLAGPVLNTSWYGGYILWARGESHRPLVDTRNLGSAEFRSRYARAWADPVALDSLLADWDFTHAVLQPPLSRSERLPVELARRPGWTLVFADDAGILLVNARHYREVAGRLGYRLLSPDYAAMGELGARAVRDSSLARQLGAELERARAESPWHARASLWLGLLRLARGEVREAVALFDEVERLEPLTPGLALRQGMARELAGDRSGAVAAFRRALKEPADSSEARAMLERLVSSGAAR